VVTVHRTAKLELAILVVSAVLLASLVSGYLIVIPAMREMIKEFDMAVPQATRIALNVKSLVIVAITAATLMAGAVHCLRVGRRNPALIFAGLSLLVTLAASTFLFYAVSLPAMTSVVTPETQTPDP